MGCSGSQCHAVWKLIKQMRSLCKSCTIGKLEAVEWILNKWPVLVLLLPGFSSCLWFLVRLSLLPKHILLWLDPVSTWSACRHKDLLSAPLRYSRTSAWAPGGLDLALGRAVCPTGLCGQVFGPAAPIQQLGNAWTHAMEEWGQPKQLGLAGWAFHEHPLESNEGQAAKPSGWHAGCYILSHFVIFYLDSAWAGSVCSPVTWLPWTEGSSEDIPSCEASCAIPVPHCAGWAPTGLGNEHPLSSDHVLNSLEEERAPSRLGFDIRWWTPHSCKACSAIENSIPPCKISARLPHVTSANLMNYLAAPRSQACANTIIEFCIGYRHSQMFTIFLPLSAQILCKLQEKQRCHHHRLP